MNLDQLLGTLSVDQLQDLTAIWAPDAAHSRSKSALFRVLRAQMTKPDRVRACLDHVDSFGHGIIRRLLRSPDAVQTVAALSATSTARPHSLEETRAAVAKLTEAGLVHVEPEKRWETYGSARVTIAEELVRPLRDVTGINERSAEEILNLADHLAALPERELAAHIQKAGFSTAVGKSIDALAAQLAEPAACSARLDALSPKVREIALTALHKRAGIVPVARLRHDLGLDLREPKPATLKLWRNELEANLIGTIGDLSLLEYGIDLDGTMLVLFTEVVEALLSAPCETEPKIPDPVGPDFLLDLAELVSVARESGARLKASGALTGAATERILAQINRPNLPPLDSSQMVDLLVICAEKLGLVERLGEWLDVRPAAHEWESRPCEAKAADLLTLVGVAVPAPRSKHHHDALCRIARDLLRSMKPGAWRPGDALTNITLRRHLRSLPASGLRNQIARAVADVDRYVLPPFPGLKQLATDIRESVVIEAYAMGILNVDFGADGPACMRLSDFGAVAAGHAPARRSPAKLIATPDFEVIILPEGDTTRLRYEVGLFTARGKFEQTYHLRITKDRVQEAVVRGIRPDDMIALLRSHAESGTIPQNVEYSIRSWADHVRLGTVEHVFVIEIPDEQLLNVVAELPDLKRLIIRRISPTALALSEPPTDRKLLADLRALGVFVR